MEKTKRLLLSSYVRDEIAFKFSGVRLLLLMIPLIIFLKAKHGKNPLLKLYLIIDYYVKAVVWDWLKIHLIQYL